MFALENYSFEILEVRKIKPYSGNARLHSKRQVRKLAASIKAFGFTNPILVDERNEIIGGHGRHEAAGLVGLDVVPVIRLCNLSESQKTALRLADNKLALDSAWSTDLLSAELQSLVGSDLDLTLTGFDGIEIDALVTPLSSEGDEDEAFELPAGPAVCQPDDLWAAGNHRIICGDARAPATFAKLLEGKQADMVFADVPYNVPIARNVTTLKRHSEFQMASGEMSPVEFQQFLLLTLGNARDMMRDGALHYVCSDWRMIAQLITVGEQLFERLMNIAVWVKPNGGLGSFYRSQHEMIAIFKQGDAKHVNNIQLGRLGRYRSNVWQYPGGSGFSKTRTQDLEDHPTVKPARMVADAIQDATMPGDLVLDPFGGAGTTLIAAEKRDRRSAIIEIEPRFVDVTLRRFQDLTGKEPCLLPEKTPLATVRKLRGDRDVRL